MGENTPALPLLATEDVSKGALVPAPDLPPKQRARGRPFPPSLLRRLNPRDVQATESPANLDPRLPYTTESSAIHEAQGSPCPYVSGEA